MKNEYGSDVVALTQGPRHHFFGYFDIQTCDSTGKYVLAMESDFDDHFPRADDTATIGMVEWETASYVQSNPVEEARISTIVVQPSDSGRVRRLPRDRHRGVTEH